MTSLTEYLTDPQDGLRAMKVGPWARIKHDLLAKYIDGTRHMRGKWPHRTYIELFSGPGRVWYKPHGPLADGSALRAWRASQRDGAEFTEMFINDLDPENFEACRRRLKDAGAPVQAFNLEAEKAAPEILDRLPRKSAVHLALLDPFSIGALPFSIVHPFASHPKIDVVVNYGDYDVERNMLLNLRGELENMTAFCPGWQKATEGVVGKHAKRAQVLKCWLDHVRDAGATYSKEMPLVRNERNRGLYHLVFAAHHPGPIRVWTDVAKTGQGILGF